MFPLRRISTLHTQKRAERRMPRRSAIRTISGIDIGKRRGKERNTPGYFFRAATAERKNAEMVLFIPASFCLFSTNWNCSFNYYSLYFSFHFIYNIYCHNCLSNYHRIPDCTRIPYHWEYYNHNTAYHNSSHQRNKQ